MVETQPDIVRPPRRMEKKEIPGRNGSLHVDSGAYEGYTKSVECALMNFNRLDDVSAWLTGSGDLIFSNEPDKVYKAVIIEGLNYTKAGLFSNRKRFSVDFECEPFKYSANANEDYFYITTPGTIFGRGTYQSEPIITVYGSGDIELDINSTNISLFDIEGYITVNSVIMNAYKLNESLNYKMSGDFPMLMPNENRISWTGDINRLEIIPNWRWL